MDKQKYNKMCFRGPKFELCQILYEDEGELILALKRWYIEIFCCFQNSRIESTGDHKNEEQL